MKGKLVNVYFQHADALFGVLVEHEPCGVGDSWALLDKDGRCHRALLFERIDECAPSEEDSASNSGGVAGEQGTANSGHAAIAPINLAIACLEDCGLSMSPSTLEDTLGYLRRAVDIIAAQQQQ